MKTRNEKSRQVASRPAGGYRLITVRQLFTVWWLYRHGPLELRDVRTWFALQEMSARRCRTARGRRPRYELEELNRLTGFTAAKQARASLRRLRLAGLAAWTESTLVFGDGAEPAATSRVAGGPVEGSMDGFEECFERITNRKRKVPVPRRTLRMLARDGRPAMVATVLGHLFRCVYAKGLAVCSEGSAAASWIAEVFGIDSRNIKRARSRLSVMGWLTVKQADHWHRQRYGGRVEVNLSFGGKPPNPQGGGARMPPLADGRGIESPPPETNRKLLNGLKNQQPAAAGGDGVHVGNPDAPSLHKVRREDLGDAGRILELYRQAQRQKIISGSECDRLRFAAAAVRARRKATRNPGGFFHRMIHARLWHHLADDDEFQARRMLAKHLHSTAMSRPPVSRRTDAPRPTSADVRLVSTVTRALESRGYTSDPYEALAREQPGWTRERWNAAMRQWLAPR